MRKISLILILILIIFGSCGVLTKSYYDPQTKSLHNLRPLTVIENTYIISYNCDPILIPGAEVDTTNILPTKYVNDSCKVELIYFSYDDSMYKGQTIVYVIKKRKKSKYFGIWMTR